MKKTLIILFIFTSFLSFSQRASYFRNGIRHGVKTVAPTASIEGETYYNGVSKKLFLWNGSVWLEIPSEGGVLTSGQATTANGTSVNLGGAYTSDVFITPTSNQRFLIGEDEGNNFEFNSANIIGQNTNINFSSSALTTIHSTTLTEIGSSGEFRIKTPNFYTNNLSVGQYLQLNNLTGSVEFSDISGFLPLVQNTPITMTGVAPVNWNTATLLFNPNVFTVKATTNAALVSTAGTTDSTIRSEGIQVVMEKNNRSIAVTENEIKIKTQIVDGSSVIGEVWTATGTDGEGDWIAPASGITQTAGTFTGVLQASGGATYTPTSSTCYYTITGKQVTIMCNFDNIIVSGSTTGVLQFSGMPANIADVLSFAKIPIEVSGTDTNHSVAFIQLGSGGVWTVSRKNSDTSNTYFTFTPPTIMDNFTFSISYIIN